MKIIQNAINRFACFVMILFFKNPAFSKQVGASVNKEKTARNEWFSRNTDTLNNLMNHKGYTLSEKFNLKEYSGRSGFTRILCNDGDEYIRNFMSDISSIVFSSWIKEMNANLLFNDTKYTYMEGTVISQKILI
jgi:hypothetical protein